MKQIADITGENQATKPMQVGPDGATIVIGNDEDFVGVLTVQYLQDDIDEWIDDVSYTGTVVDRVLPLSEDVEIRIGCKLGDYTSGAIRVIITRGYSKE